MTKKSVMPAQAGNHFRFGLILALDYFDGWLPACAGMTDFFVMYGGKLEGNQEASSPNTASPALRIASAN